MLLVSADTLQLATVILLAVNAVGVLFVWRLWLQIDANAKEISRLANYADELETELLERAEKNGVTLSL